MAPDLNVLGAITDCNKGRYDKRIPYLEKRLRDSASPSRRAEPSLDRAHSCALTAIGA